MMINMARSQKLNLRQMSLTFFLHISSCREQQVRGTSGMVMSMLTRGNGGLQQKAIMQAEGSSAQLKLMRLQS